MSEVNEWVYEPYYAWLGTAPPGARCDGIWLAGATLPFPQPLPSLVRSAEELIDCGWQFVLREEDVDTWNAFFWEEFIGSTQMLLSDGTWPGVGWKN